MSALFTELNTIKQELEEWRKSLPSYYEPLTVPLQQPRTMEEVKKYEKYPYNEKMEYVTGLKCKKI
jgi:hypothetical protein